VEGGALAAAVQGQAGAADVGGLGGGQEQARAGYVVGGRHPAQRDGGGDGGGGLLVAVDLRRRLGGDEPGDHGVDPDLGPPFDGQAGDQVVQAGLGRAVGGGARRGAAAAHAADHDDRPAAGLGLHDLVGGLRDVQRRDQVQLDDPGVEPGRGGGGSGLRGTARVAHHHVDPAEQLYRGGDELPGLLRVPDVDLGKGGLPVARGGLPVARGGQGGGLGPAADQHAAARTQEGTRDARANTPGAAGYDDPCAGKRLVDASHGAMLGSRPSKR
jgi:hypothetical protein